ncbi:MAG: DUF86 domain-containing protein [Methanomassiliicoccaceae archaeon]|jgi:uncharacterized protein with HEPN domain|nr:DUF86 domain-containing protein [Methanomassiliicoccaceae archaeon]
MKRERNTKGNDRLLIETIIYYCDEIAGNMDYYGKDEIKFMEDRHFQRDCAFCIAQIGETAGDLSEELTYKHPEIIWRDIIGTRNIINHGYGVIKLNTVWAIVTEDVPVLKAACEKILNDL